MVLGRMNFIEEVVLAFVSSSVGASCSKGSLLTAVIMTTPTTAQSYKIFNVPVYRIESRHNSRGSRAPYETLHSSLVSLLKTRLVGKRASEKKGLPNTSEKTAASV